MSRSPDSLRAVFLRHRPRLLLTVLLLWTTMLAGTALLGLSGGFSPPPRWLVRPASAKASTSSHRPRAYAG